ncbi:hypothetical protein Fmac_004466 [Flemingia macrophylla]|uniref:PDZ domain-containing protein n=1 Tax=Flemingia macrophylla TaxID=520843 RepID=A0ABD1N4Z7_9FABA
MSLSTTTTSGHSSLYSALTLPRTTTQVHPTFFKFFSSRSPSYSGVSYCFSNTFLSRPLPFAVKASSEVGSEASKQESEGEEEAYEEYEVELEQPLGLKFAKGRDGGTYIDAIAPGGSADKAGVFTVGDKVLATSAVFGTEIWPAADYGRTMYTIRQRIGPLLMKMQRRYGKSIDSGGELTEKEIIRAERNSGVISNRVREIQLLNATRKREQKERREKDLREGLQLYKSGKYEEALEKFESILGSKPEPEEASVASYNVACCYSKLNQARLSCQSLLVTCYLVLDYWQRVQLDSLITNLDTREQHKLLLKKINIPYLNDTKLNNQKNKIGFSK